MLAEINVKDKYYWKKQKERNNFEKAQRKILYVHKTFDHYLGKSAWCLRKVGKIFKIQIRNDIQEQIVWEPLKEVKFTLAQIEDVVQCSCTKYQGNLNCNSKKPTWLSRIITKTQLWGTFLLFPPTPCQIKLSHPHFHPTACGPRVMHVWGKYFRLQPLPWYQTCEEHSAFSTVMGCILLTSSAPNSSPDNWLEQSQQQQQHPHPPNLPGPAQMLLQKVFLPPTLSPGWSGTYIS